ncbi:MAG: hypothetical protein ACTSWU_00100 [Candidatus Thorarchaeota archaeon]
MMAWNQRSKRWYWPDYINIDGKKCACVYQDRLELEKEAEDNPRLRQILFNRTFVKERWFHDGQLFEDFVIPALFWKVVIHNGMAVIHLMGPSNGGKSYLAHAYAHELLGYWEYYRGIEGNVWYFFSYAQAMNHLSEFKQGDIVIIDEHSKQLGQDSLASAVKFNNMLRATRKRGVSYIICDPEEQNVPNCQYMQRTAFYIEENSMTRTLTYTGKTHRLLGISDWIVPLEEEWFKNSIDEYERQKDDYLELFAQRGGAADKGLAGKARRMAENLHKYAKERWMHTDDKGWVKTLNRYMVELGYDGETFATRDLAVDMMVEYLKMIFDKDSGWFDWSISFDPSAVRRDNPYAEPSVPDELKPELIPYLGQVDDLRNAVLDRMRELGADPEIVEAFRIVRDLIDSGEWSLEEAFHQWQELFPASDILEDSFRITKYYGMKNYQGAELAGWANAFEDVYSAMLTEKGINHIMGGRNTPEPDCVILDELDRPVEIHSLKTFLNKQGYENFTYDQVADSEKNLGVPIKLVVFSVVDNKLYTFDVDDDFIENGVRVVGKSSRLPRGRPRKKEERVTVKQSGPYGCSQCGKPCSGEISFNWKDGVRYLCSEKCMEESKSWRIEGKGGPKY